MIPEIVGMLHRDFQCLDVADQVRLSTTTSATTKDTLPASTAAHENYAKTKSACGPNGREKLKSTLKVLETADLGGIAARAAISWGARGLERSVERGLITFARDV